MTAKEARKYISDSFKHSTELRSCFQEVTDDGVFNKAQSKKFDDETAISVAEDLKYQFRQEMQYLMSDDEIESYRKKVGPIPSKYE